MTSDLQLLNRNVQIRITFVKRFHSATSFMRRNRRGSKLNEAHGIAVMNGYLQHGDSRSRHGNPVLFVIGIP